MGTHYIIQNNDMTEEQVEQEKQHFKQRGFKVVIIKNGNGNILDGINQLILNHIE